MAALLELLWGDSGARVVISTDLSHQIPALLARQLDPRTAESICRLEPPAHEMACGAAAVAGVLAAARDHRLDVELLDLRPTPGATRTASSATARWRCSNRH